MSTISYIALSFTLIAFAGTETDSGTDTGTDTSTDTGTDESTDDSNCGDHCSGQVDPQILSPADGAMVESPFMVAFDPGSDCWCDTCGCYPVDYDQFQLRANGELVVNGSYGELGPYTVELEPGTYELVLSAAWDFGLDAESAPITVTVIEGDPPATDSEGGNLTAGESAGEESTGDAGVESDAGCNCSTTDQLPGLGGLALLGLLALRRRRA